MVSIRCVLLPFMLNRKSSSRSFFYTPTYPMFVFEYDKRYNVQTENAKRPKIKRKKNRAKENEKTKQICLHSYLWNKNDFRQFAHKMVYNSHQLDVAILWHSPGQYMIPYSFECVCVFTEEESALKLYLSSYSIPFYLRFYQRFLLVGFVRKEKLLNCELSSQWRHSNHYYSCVDVEEYFRQSDNEHLLRISRTWTLSLSHSLTHTHAEIEHI